MSLLTRVTNLLSRRSNSDVVPQQLWRSILAGGTDAGIEVTPRTALFSSAILAGVRRVSSDVATTPFNVYREIEPVGRQRLKSHWLASLYAKPNPEQNWLNFRRAMTVWVMLWGNAYAEIEINPRSGWPVALWPIEPWRVRVDRDDKGLIYRINDPVPGGKSSYRSSELFHLQGFSTSGVYGEAISLYGKECIGAILAVQKFAARYFGAGTRPSGIVTIPGKMTSEAMKQFVEFFEEVMSGGHNSHKTALLSEGKTWSKISADPEEAQMLGTRAFSVAEASRLTGCPVHKMGELGRATWSNVEQMETAYVNDTLNDYWRMWEAETQSKLIAPSGEKDLFVAHDDKSRLRGDFLARSQGYALMCRTGALLIDEWREAELLNPHADGLGSMPFMSVDMSPVKNLLNAPVDLALAGDPADPTNPIASPIPTAPVAPTPADEEVEDDADTSPVVELPDIDPNEPNPNAKTGPVSSMVGTGLILDQFGRANGKILSDAIRRALHTEKDKVVRQSKKGGVEAWADEFYAKHEDYLRGIIESPIRSFVDSAIAVTSNANLIANKGQVLAMASTLAKRHVDASRADIDDDTGLQERVDGWEEYRVQPFTDTAMDEVGELIKGFLV